jgi:hypothetical protein
MDSACTIPKQCSKKSCKQMIPPPAPGCQDLNTCDSCHACDGVSKSKNKQKQGDSQVDDTRQQAPPMTLMDDGGKEPAIMGADNAGPVDTNVSNILCQSFKAYHGCKA